MTKITNIKPLGDDRFELFFDSLKESYIVKYNHLKIVDDEEPMPFIVPENPKFSDIWGSNPALRREILKVLKEHSSGDPDS